MSFLPQHSESEHVFQPNVVVSNTRSGLDAVHLFTGRALCTVPLLAGDGHTAYADVNGDLVIDRIVAVPGNPHAVHATEQSRNAVQMCWANAMSGVPPTEALWNGSICGDSSWLGTFDDDYVDTVSPVLLSKHEHGVKRARYDAAFLVSTGLVTLYSPEGTLLWHADSGARWTPNTRQRGEFVPSLTPMTLEMRGAHHGNADHVLAIGEDQLAVVGVDSIIVIQTPVRRVQAPPLLVDVNKDGWTDLVLLTVEGVSIMTLHHKSGGSVVVFAALITTAVLMLVLSKRTELRHELISWWQTASIQ
eukprot:TRINITY_DN824_c0_g1_i6.p2 TRINITY_DN824_c0_g1~~TRINITY_DN824_c0_g1_i6.p2  ORF type:complete len:304 (+),score=55.76 TRINITY_DN824_c0_g1_i6:1099-2010(+)